VFKCFLGKKINIQIETGILIDDYGMESFYNFLLLVAGIAVVYSFVLYFFNRSYFQKKEMKGINGEVRDYDHASKSA
jgi:hypothetical protein